jgi:hypothetical protein
VILLKSFLIALALTSTAVMAQENQQDPNTPESVEDERGEANPSAGEDRPAMRLEPLPPRRQLPERWRTYESSHEQYCDYLRTQVIPRSRTSPRASQVLLIENNCN